MIMIFSGALAHIDTLHVDWHLGANWQVPERPGSFRGLTDSSFLGPRGSEN